MIWKWHRTCEAAWPYNERYEVQLEKPVHCDLREGHANSHEGVADYVTGRSEMVYWK